MISDTLSDAIVEVEQYQRDFRSVYDSVAAQIESLLAHMRHVRKALDGAEPPAPFTEPPR